MIKVEGLVYIYEDGTRALNGIDMDLSKGSTIGLIGANGSGKSTLLLTLMGVLKPTKGVITLGGLELKTNKESLREHRKIVNMVFQDPDRQIFYSRVFDDVAFGPRNLDMPEGDVRRRVEGSLNLVRMSEHMERPVHFLSYGQKKRVAIAGVLSMDPQVIIMDEPSSGLDPEMRESLKGIIDLLSKEKTVLVSSHDMDFIYEVCDYVYVLGNGSIIGEGAPERVFLDRGLLTRAKLDMPWLARLHLDLGLPLWKNSGQVSKKGMEVSE